MSSIGYIHYLVICIMNINAHLFTSVQFLNLFLDLYNISKDDYNNVIEHRKNEWDTKYKDLFILSKEKEINCLPYLFAVHMYSTPKHFSRFLGISLNDRTIPDDVFLYAARNLESLLIVFYTCQYYFL